MVPLFCSAFFPSSGSFLLCSCRIANAPHPRMVPMDMSGHGIVFVGQSCFSRCHMSFHAVQLHSVSIWFRDSVSSLQVGHCALCS